MITKVLSGGIQSLNMEEGSYKVFLVAPNLGDAPFPQIRVMTKAINQLLWEWGADECRQNHHQLYRTLHLKPNAKPFTGTLLQPPFHTLCVKGATFETLSHDPKVQMVRVTISSQRESILYEILCNIWASRNLNYGLSLWSLRVFRQPSL
jgi:hypothetical protein